MTLTHREGPPAPSPDYIGDLDTEKHTTVPDFVPATWEEQTDIPLGEPATTSADKKEERLPRTSGEAFRARDAQCLAQLPPDIAAKMEVVWVKDGGEEEPVEAWRAIALEEHIPHRLTASPYTLREESAYTQHELGAPAKILPTVDNIFRLVEAEDRGDSLAPYSEVIVSKCKEWFENSATNTPSSKDTLEVALVWYETQRKLFTRQTAARLTDTAPSEKVYPNERTLNGERYWVNNAGETVKVEEKETVIADTLNEILQKAGPSVPEMYKHYGRTGELVDTPAPFGPKENPDTQLKSNEYWASAILCYEQYKQDVESALQEIKQHKLQVEKNKRRRLNPNDY